MRSAWIKTGYPRHPALGAIAVQCRAGDEELLEILREIDDPRTHAETAAERAFLAKLGAGYSTPVACQARYSDGQLEIRGRCLSHDGGRVIEVAGIDSADEALLGDLSFRITQECSDDGATCEPVCEDTDCDVCDEGQPPSMGGCWITGIGFLTDSDGRDNFGGNGMPMKAGYIRGEWEHDDHATGDKFHGRVTYLYCRHVDEPGPGQPSGPDHNFTINQAYYGGPGRWFEPGVGWQDGYWFDVMAEDHGEPGKTDEYYFNVRRMNATEQVLYGTGGVLGGGNFQIHPPNDGHPFTRGQVPQWVSLV